MFLHERIASAASDPDVETDGMDNPSVTSRLG
jgi:hypothetical protein